MSDVRGFSALAAEMRPDDLIEILNSYLSRMIDTLLEFEGVVNEIIGDGILAFFGAPTDMKDHPARAVACALKMQRVLEEVNAHNKELGRPSLEMGIAVVTGKVVVGNIGSDKRCKYGAVGANMNLAGRMESLAVGGQVLITRATYERVADMVLLQNSFSVELKGLPEPVEIYDVMGIAGPYGIHLKPVHDRVVELDTPIRAVFQKLSEKVVDQEERDVAISQISLKGAVFSSRFDLAVRDDLRCTLASHESLGAACQIYAKVECVELWGGANRVTVRFTSLSKDAEMFIRRLCEADKANYRYNLAAMGAPARMDVQ
jgi:class 3 adenylate cyclase